MSKSELRTAEIDATRRYVFARAGYRCEVCGRPLSCGTPQLAHRIPQNTRNLARYGKRVVHHPLNLAATCCLKCNAAVDIRNHPVLVAELVGRIKSALEEV